MQSDTSNLYLDKVTRLLTSARGIGRAGRVREGYAPYSVELDFRDVDEATARARVAWLLGQAPYAQIEIVPASAATGTLTVFARVDPTKLATYLSEHVHRIHRVTIKGYRPFRDMTAKLSRLEVIVGANGAGKSSLLEFLKLLRDASREDIPPEIVVGSVGQQIFHGRGSEIEWDVEIQLYVDENVSGEMPLRYVRYQGVIAGQVGNHRVARERLESVGPLRQTETGPFVYMDMREQKGYVADQLSGVVATRSKLVREERILKRPSQLTLSTMTNPAQPTLYTLREYVSGWRFYNSFNINQTKIRAPVILEQQPVLHEDCGNLSAVLFYLASEHPSLLGELKARLRLAIPGFADLNVKARGLGQVLALWREQGIKDDVSLADLSDGVLRFMCWLVLCLVPNPPSLLCIDEPELGIHPRALPVLAGSFQKASFQTQILLATHSSYFLTLFDIKNIAVMKKVDGASRYLKPMDSAALRANLEEFGITELEAMHRGDELEALV